MIPSGAELIDLITSAETREAVQQAARNLAVGAGSKMAGGKAVELLFGGERREVEKAFRNAIVATLNEHSEMGEIAARFARWLGRPPLSEGFLAVLVQPDIDANAAALDELMADSEFDLGPLPISLPSLLQSLRANFFAALYQNPKTRSIYHAVIQHEQGLEQRILLRRQQAMRVAQERMEKLLQDLALRQGIPVEDAGADLPPPYPGTPPSSPEVFLGREEDLSILKERLGVARAAEGPGSVQTLTAVRGWPGIGKTTLATVLAHDTGVAGAFPDGVLWASLGTSPNLLVEMATWGRALGSDDLLRARTLREATSVLASLLRDRRMLLIVDDVWEAGHVIPFQQARGSRCVLLITTRQPGVGRDLSLSPEAVYSLPALTEERSLDLLRILAPQVVSGNPGECLELVRDLECLPLALHVAGRMLNAESEMGWGVADLLRELRQGTKVIEAQAPAAMLDYESQTIPTVAALLRKSTDRLDESTRDCFAFLGAFASKPATFDLGALKPSGWWRTPGRSSGCWSSADSWSLLRVAFRCMLYWLRTPGRSSPSSDHAEPS